MTSESELIGGWDAFLDGTMSHRRASRFRDRMESAGLVIAQDDGTWRLSANGIAAFITHVRRCIA